MEDRRRTGEEELVLLLVEDGQALQDVGRLGEAEELHAHAHAALELCACTGTDGVSIFMQKYSTTRGNESMQSSEHRKPDDSSQRTGSNAVGCARLHVGRTEEERAQHVGRALHAKHTVRVMVLAS